MWYNLHTHSNWCDGRSTIREHVRQAELSGLHAIGFASHAPLPFPCAWCVQPGRLEQYLQEIDSVRRQSAMPVYAGLEVDFIPGVIGPSDFRSTLDFTIGSVHFVDGTADHRWEADSDAEVFRNGLDRFFGGDVQGAVMRYFALIREMLSSSPPDILGHMDRIKVHNSNFPFFDESSAWYLDELVHTLEAARDAGVIVEVNTRGLYRKRSLEPYPGRFALMRMAEMKIPVMLASDAHHREELVAGFPEAVAFLNQAGIREVVRFNGTGWEPCAMPDC